MFQKLDEQHYRALIEHSLEAMALIQADGKVSFVSPAISRILGYSHEEFVNLDAFQIVHPADRDDAQKRFDQLLSNPEETQSTVNRVRHKDGSWKWIETVSINSLAVPNVGAIISNFRDVTESKRAAEALRRAEEQFRFIVESATEFAIFTTDLDGRVSSWNSGASRILGYEESEVIGQSCRIFFVMEDNARNVPESEMRDALTLGHGNDERWHLRKDGSRFWGSGYMMPLRDDSGDACGYLKIFRDMTREKRAEESLKDADRKKDGFLAVLAHELRNPLGAITHATAVLGASSDEQSRNWCQQVIERQTKNLARLLDDLLDVSRITQGKIRLRNERLDLAAVIQRAAEVVRPLLIESKHALMISVPAEGLMVNGDSTRIEQVIVNVLTNAIKYTNDGGTISISAQGAKEAVIQVRDDGIGISAEMQSQIFEPFSQVDHSLDRSKGGLGVGLTLARSFVEMHGGSISVKSDGLGQGSVFTIRLPLAGSQKDVRMTPIDNNRGPQLQTFRILVVDDNHDSVVGLEKLLSAAGYELMTASDGHSALQVALAERPDAILMDIGLPGLDGYAVASEVRKDGNCAGCLLVAISGYGQEVDRRRSREAGFDHHFLKPVDHKDLLKMLAEELPRPGKDRGV